MNDEDLLVMLWFYTDFIDESGHQRINKNYLKSLYDELKQEDDDGRIRILNKMIDIIK